MPLHGVRERNLVKQKLVAILAALTVALTASGCSSSEPTPTKTADATATDTRDFYILGNGAGALLKESNWGAVVSDAHKLAKSETSNEYTITLDLYVGDEFQFAINSDWADQKGAGYMTETELDGESYFEDSEGAGLNSDPNKANIKVAKDGNYTLTLTTNPDDPSKDTITWVRNGDAEAAVDYTKLNFFIRGNLITEWGFSHDNAYKMTSFLNGTYEYTTELFEGDDFVFYNLNEDGTPGNMIVNADAVDVENSTENVIVEPGKNIKVAASGTYSFEYNAPSNKLVVSYDPALTQTYAPTSDWFIVGSGASSLLLTSGWGKSNGFEAIGEDYRLVADGENRYSITLDLAKGDQFTIAANPLWGRQHGFSFLDSPSKDGTEYFTQSENIRVAEPGNYTITLVVDPASFSGDKIEWIRNGNLTSDVTGPFDVFIKAAGNGWELSDPYPTADGVATFTYDFAADEAFTLVYYDSTNAEERGSYSNPGSSILGVEKGSTGSADADFDVQGNDFVAKKAGTYQVTIDFTGGGPVVDFAPAQ